MATPLQDPDRRVTAYVVALAAFGVACLFAATLLQLAEGLPAPTWANTGALAVFVAAFYVLGQTSFTFTWRGHRHRMVLDEVPLYVGLLALPAPLVVLLVGVASVLEQARMRRDLRKAVFNLSQNVLAASVAAAVFLALREAGAAEVLAALPSAVLYPIASNFLMAGIFSRLSGGSHAALFRDRFLGAGLVAGSVGAGGGVAVATLWSVHPLTLLALGPFVFLTYRYGVLTAAADRELDVHKRLAEAAQHLVGTSDLEQAARSILRACGEAFPGCGRAELILDGRDGAIVEDFDPGPESGARPLEAPVPGSARVSERGRPIGTLRLHPRRAAAGITEVEEALVRIVAAQLGAAVEEARALSLEERAKRRLETYLGTAPDAILFVADGRVRYANPAAERLFGLAPGEACALAELLPDAERALPASADLVETRARGRAGAGERVVEVRAGRVPQEEGTLLLVRDVTERKRLEEESARQREMLARQEKLSALGTLVAGVAHEINNPVTYMRGALELASLDLDQVEAERSPEAVAHARASIQRLAQGVDRVERITHALKAVARQGNGERAPEDARAILDDVVQVVRVGLPKGVRLETEAAPAPLVVRANAGEMHQVLLNLVKNAAEALAPTGGTVRARAWAQGRDVLVEVADDGPGIPEAVQRRLFEPFFTTKRNGTGLGLSLSKGIVEAHGGDLTLESAPGRGTRFTVRLPALDA